MGLLIIIGGSLWAVLGLSNIVLSGAWKTSGTTMQSAVLIFNFAVFILPGWIVVGVGAILEIKPLLNKLLAELEETNQYLSELVEKNDTTEESEEIPRSSDYLENFCSKCIHFQEQTGVCQYFSVNVRDYPKKFLKLCDGKFFVQRPTKEGSPSSEEKVHFSCNECGKKFVATKDKAGESGKCNNCGASILVPVSD